MKFKIEIEVEILDDELLEMINNDRKWEDKPLYENIKDIPESEIMEWYEYDESYFKYDIIDYGFDIDKITIIKE